MCVYMHDYYLDSLDLMECLTDRPAICFLEAFHPIPSRCDMTRLHTTQPPVLSAATFLVSYCNSIFAPMLVMVTVVTDVTAAVYFLSYCFWLQ